MSATATYVNGRSSSWFWMFRCFFAIVLAAKPHLRYWNPSLSSKTSSNAYFDRLPCNFSRFSASLQGNGTFSRQVQFYCSGAQNHENCHGSLSKQVFHGKSKSSSKFLYIIFKNRSLDIGWNARSFKNTEKTRKSWCLANEHFFFFLRPPLLRLYWI